MAGDMRLQNLMWAGATVLFIIVTSALIGWLASWFGKLRGFSQEEQRKLFWGFAFAGPWVSGFIIFVLGPSLASLYYSFTEYKIGDPIEWIGIENYRVLLLGEGAHGRRFIQALYNSFYYALIGVPLQILASLGMAVLLNRALPGMRIFRMVFYLPVILAGSPAAILGWRYMLNSNGGFVNEGLKAGADSFFLFDWFYRAFIFSVESFNGFYAGIVRGNPVGALKFTLPALIGVLVLLPLLGDWDEGKKSWARRVIEILGTVILAMTLPKGLVSTPVDLTWTLFAGMVVVVLILVNRHEGKNGLARIWAGVSLLMLALSAAMTLYTGSLSNPDTLNYLGVMSLIALPIVFSLIANWNRATVYSLMGVSVLLGLIIALRVIPGAFHLDEIGTYLSFGSTIKDPANLDYLEDIYPGELMSSLWIYGLVILSLLGIIFSERHPRLQQGLVGLALFGFLLFGAGSLLDGRAYFDDFESISQESGTPNYHFALFRTASQEMPDDNRVPLWITNELWSKPAIILILMWSSGTGMLIFLAALKGVPGTLYEAASMDGANSVQQFFRITLPMISPAIFYNVVIGVIAALQTFEVIYVMQNTQGAVNVDSYSSAAYFLFVRTFRQLSIGQGAAASWILAAIIIVLTIFQFRYSRWVNYET